MIADRISKLREKLEEQILRNDPYESIYETSKEIDELVTSYYKENILKDMINAYYQLAVPVINSHKNIKFIDLFNSDLFNENDFLNFCYFC